MIRPQTELDYCLTTITRKLEKAGLLSVFNGFRKVQRILTNLVGIRTMIENTAFYPDAPENSDVSEPIRREKPESLETTGVSGNRA